MGCAGAGQRSLTRAGGLSDVELMRRIQCDDAQAFQVLYERYCSMALAVARTVSQDAECSQDAVQEAFLSLWRTRTRYDPDRATVKTWMMMMVRNRTIDIVRSTSAATRRVEVCEASERRLAADVFGHGADQDAMLREDARVMRTSLRRLPGPQREVIALVYYAGLTHMEVALLLHLPSGTIKSRMRLGLEKLRRDVHLRADGLRTAET